MSRLLLVSIPRSVSSFVYQQVCRVAGYRQCDFTSDGEILNPKRYEASGDEGGTIEARYYGEMRSVPYFEKDPSKFGVFHELLDSIPDGFAIKDVVQPWVVRGYIEKNPGKFKVIYIRRPIEQVRFALDRRGWSEFREIEKVDDYFSRFPTINANAALYDDDYISLKIASFGIEAGRHEYIDEAFVATRESFFRAYYNLSGSDSASGDKQQLETARLAYRYILGREPENEQVVQNLAACGSFMKMRAILLSSNEFSRLYRALPRNNAD
ncbi:MAG: hypothetical protein CML29_14370 [Rhizobiales bacterium]|nr:hypothetical protein [Hyphomicrobiales bacterium]MBA69217.1 hypothetical protein [Hyphomicrobiales bacterium]|tara:strand:- start:649 stop:1452 length:804 start_codon:yes stop_codon:yes gene_type:complete